MKSNNWKINSSDVKLYQFDTDHKVYCANPKCNGFGVIFRSKDIDRKLCINCGHWIYRDEKTKLKYEMKERGVKVE